MSELISVWIMTHHPVCHGGGGIWIEALESLMEERLSGHGEAISQLEFDVYFGTRLGPLKTFEQHWPEYHQKLASLPKARFLRKKRAFRLECHASFAPAEIALEVARPLRVLPPALIGQPGALRKIGCSVRQEALEPLTRVLSADLATVKLRVKKTDAFDWRGFLAAVDQLPAELPRTLADADVLAQRRESRHAAKVKADPWVAVDVDWDDFHPSARRILNDPWYWSCGDDWAPHGNDAGSDVLHDMMKRRGSAWSAVHEALTTLTDHGSTWMNTDSAIARRIAEADPQMYTICEQTLIAVAFAELKLAGSCSDHFHKMALNALLRLSSTEMIDFWSGHLNPEQQTEWQRRLAQMTQKLEEIPVG